jgi:hypothetical protein
MDTTKQNRKRYYGAFRSRGYLCPAPAAAADFDRISGCTCESSASHLKIPNSFWVRAGRRGRPAGPSCLSPKSSALTSGHPMVHRAGGRGNRGNLRVHAPRQQRLDHFKTEIYGRVEGRLTDRMWQVIDIIGTSLDANQVHGHVAQFGVHHGLFLFLLIVLRNDDEQCFAIDVFDDQQLNLDCSGRGSLQAFLSHIETLIPEQRPFFKVVQRDTLSLSAIEVVDLFGRNGVNFFSVDAGHSVQHLRNDLCLVQEVLVAAFSGNSAQRSKPSVLKRSAVADGKRWRLSGAGP